MDLNEITVFVRVVEAGSFVRAAQQLGMPKSTVSAKVSALERRLGVTLIRRTTRKLFVTEAGQGYYRQCVQGLQQIATAEEQVVQGQAVPHGRLRITAPVELGGTLLPGVLSQFQKQYPEVNVEVILTDRTVDLISEGIDLGLRAGNLKDSSLISRKLGTVYFALFASPQYLKSAGSLKTPKDLKNHYCLHFPPIGLSEWKLAGPRGTQTATLNQHMVINDLNLIKALAVEGLGIALLPTLFCYPETQSEKLVRVLREWKSNVRPVHFIYPHQDFVPKKLSAFLDVGTEVIRGSLRSFDR